MIERLKALGRDPRFHGNGFTQLYLTPEYRLHVWHPELPPLRDHNATIHNHIWDMESHVLMGLLIQKEFEVGAYQHGDYQIHAVDQEAVRSNKGQFYIPGGRYHVAETREYKLAAGSSYTFPAHEFHSSDAEGLTATLMKKGQDIYLRPSILAPVNEPPVNAFDPKTQPSQDRMWTAIHDALDLMPNAGWRKLRSILPN